MAGAEYGVYATVGLGADRYNHVSDAASLRAIAELTKMPGGFGGSISIIGPMLNFYRKCLAHIYRNQTFRSVLSGAIVASGEGA